jgi:hypothetical protein
LGGTWTFTNPLGLRTRFRIPAGVLTQTTTFTYTESRDIPHPPPAGLSSAGRSFDLGSSWPVNGRITVTVEYRDQDWVAAGIQPESSLRLYYWNGSSNAWDNVANTCTPVPSYAPNTGVNALVAPLCHLSEFALLGASGEEEFAIYLPLVLKNR